MDMDVSIQYRSIHTLIDQACHSIANMYKEQKKTVAENLQFPCMRTPFTSYAKSAKSVRFVSFPLSL
jgi:hypothetical protein